MFKGHGCSVPVLVGDGGRITDNLVERSVKVGAQNCLANDVVVASAAVALGAEKIWDASMLKDVNNVESACGSGGLYSTDLYFEAVAVQMSEAQFVGVPLDLKDLNVWPKLQRV